MRKLQLGELTAHLAGGVDGNGGGGGPIVVLMHGFGAPATDLVPLATEVPANGPLRFVFPAAPWALEAGPPDRVGRAWWSIDREALQDAIVTRRYDELVQHTPEGLAEARQALESLLGRVEEELGTSAPIFLGGFSQGAMLATDTVLRGSRPFAGLIVLSGSLICQKDWSEQATARAGLPVFQSHGNLDPILPFPTAERLRDTLLEGGLLVEFRAFRGGHGIPGEVLTALGAFIARHASSR